jgi:hypothetical protein
MDMSSLTPRPRGTPAGGDRLARRRYAAAGDAARGFCNGNSGTADEAPCPEADIGHALPIISDASSNAIAIVRRTQLRTLLVSGWSARASAFSGLD